MSSISNSEQINELATALSKAQGEMRNVIKNAHNPFFKSKYADLASVIDTVREALAKNGLSHAQFPSMQGQIVTVTTVLMHSSGQWLSGDISAKAKDESPQSIGSATTYLRRYGLLGALGLATDEDDDGNAASLGKEEPAKYRGTDEDKNILRKIFQKLNVPSDKMKLISETCVGKNIKDLEQIVNAFLTEAP